MQTDYDGDHNINTNYKKRLGRLWNVIHSYGYHLIKGKVHEELLYKAARSQAVVVRSKNEANLSVKAWVTECVRPTLLQC